MKRIYDTEPALLLGAVQAILALAVSFGLELTGEQTGAILAASAAVLSVLLRRKVTPE